MAGEKKGGFSCRLRPVRRRSFPGSFAPNSLALSRGDPLRGLGAVRPRLGRGRAEVGPAGRAMGRKPRAVETEKTGWSEQELAGTGQPRMRTMVAQAWATVSVSCTRATRMKDSPGFGSPGLLRDR